MCVLINYFEFQKHPMTVFFQNWPTHTLCTQHWKDSFDFESCDINWYKLILCVFFFVVATGRSCHASLFLWFDYTSSHFSLLCGAKVFCMLVLQDGSLSISDSFPLEIPNYDDVIAVQQEESFLFLLHSTGDICILMQ